MGARELVVTALLAVGLASACSAPPTSAARDASPPDASTLPDPRLRSGAPELALRGLEHVPRTAPRCSRDDEAPLRTGDDVDTFRCTRLGAREVSGDATWPDTAGLTGVVLFVDPAAAPNGDGRRESPLRTLSEALARRPEAQTVVLSRGVHPIVATAEIPRSLTVLGVGAGATTLAIPRGRVGLRIAVGATVTVSSATLSYPSGPPENADVAIESQGALTLRDVAVEAPSVGVDLVAGSLSAQHLSVRRAARVGISALSGADLELVDFVVRDGEGQGIRVERGHASLTRGLVARNARHGVVLLGATNSTTGRARCADAASRGAVDCVDQLVSQGNGVAGVYVSDPRRVELRRSTLADTMLTAIEGGEAGDGLFVGADADLAMDPELISPTVRGFGSALIGNARAGLVAQGARARIAVRGAVFARNASGGVFVGARAQATVIGESFFVENRFAGIVGTPGSEVGIVQCNGIVDTQMGTIRGSTATVQLGDAVHVNGALGMSALRDNTILRSAAFGLLVNAGRVALEGNRGADNRYGVGLYGGAILAGDARTIPGREAAPTTAPALAAELR